ncbi:hypothetical protein GCM10027271_43100 [Saccharopolyspora gloriosae]|uniref:Multicopper oxidase n=1 Tax=Saccharopolyspora gloriosae TaxID=455344 RepID=A0A840NMS2_9PSEU|nr:copper oxidase [Saccharopolyspora gloriosae]MBB5070392.1 hypothetical protein [Saccharopolyspora gloriosae]
MRTTMQRRYRSSVLARSTAAAVLVAGVALAEPRGVGWIDVGGFPAPAQAVGFGLFAFAFAMTAVVLALAGVDVAVGSAAPATRWVQRSCAAALAMCASLAVVAPARTALSGVFLGRPESLPDAGGIVHEVAVVAPVLVVAAAVVCLPTTVIVALGAWCRERSWRRASVAGVLAVLVVVPLCAVPATGDPGPPPPAAPPSSGVCPAGARQITYDLSAFQLDIPLNGWGDHLPDGLVYALKNDDARVGKRDLERNPQLSQPLTIRANVGDCVRIELRNDIRDRRVGIHPDGLVQFDPRDSDGAMVGGNPDTSLGHREQGTFTWYADHEGQAPVVDIANLDSAAEGSTSTQRGLFGGVIVHPRGSTWHDPITGADLLDRRTGRAVQSELFADVHVPGGEDHRSFAIMIMDEVEGVRDRDGEQPTFPTTGLADATFGINYRSEPLRNRLRAILEHRGTPTPENPSGTAKTITLPNGRTFTPQDHFCDGYVVELDRVVEDPGAKCQSEESHLQSWVFGDEGKLTRPGGPGAEPVVDTDAMISKAYVGDPVRFALIHPGVRETHPWHQHTQRWFADPDNPTSPRKDVQAIGPGEAFELRLEGGAGGVQGTVGDSVFHCHFYPHFAQGFWGHLRIFDRLRDGAAANPDGTPLQALRELPDRAGATPAPDARHPGFPLFVEGQFGQRAYKPPHTVIEDDFAELRRPGDTVRGPTPMEAANMPALDPAKPGAGFVDPCPPERPERTYRPHAIDLPLLYNEAGWKDRQGRLYVEESHLDAVTSGRERPEPYTIRARQGDCMRILLTNDLHLDEDPDEPIDHVNRFDGDYMLPEETSEVSAHVHLVQFDELASDGTSVGFNYAQTAMLGQTAAFRWYVDEPLRSVFFHDHQYPSLHQQKGLYASMNVEPPDAVWRDTRTGEPTDGVGTEAIIESDLGMDFREFTLYYADRVPLWRNFGAGPPVQPPGVPGDFGEDQGGYAVNYRNEPFQIRTRPGLPGPRGDPAYVYSSTVHGDPATPVLRAYTGEPVLIRNIAAAHEEMHDFTLHGHKWLNEPDNPNSELTDQQALGLAEYFNYEIIGSNVVHRGMEGEQLKDEAEVTPGNGGPAIVNRGAGGPGDFLYGSTALDDQWLGLWGIFRTTDRPQPDLAPLPDHGLPGQAPAREPAADRSRPHAPRRAEPMNTCPSTAPVRRLGVDAVEHPLRFNPDDGDHDPFGLAYVRSQDAAAVRAGLRPPEPLVLRARAGECIEITLTNGLRPGGQPPHGNHVPLPADAPFPRGDRVSLHGGMVDYDVRTSDGSTVGFNADQTVRPGESITTYWFAAPEIEGSTITLSDFGDRRGNAHHSLFGTLIIEPPGSIWTDPVTGRPATGTAADVRWVEDGAARATREFVAIWQDGVRLFDRDGEPNPEAVSGEDVDLDPYERGNRGINYRNERFAPRLRDDPEQAHMFSSRVHGDPATPVFRAHQGDPVTVRFVHGADRGRVHTMLVSGHMWRYQRADANAAIRSAVGGMLPETEATVELIGGAGGPGGRTGDFLIRDGLTINQVNAGLWGLLRVEPRHRPGLLPLNGRAGPAPEPVHPAVLPAAAIVEGRGAPRRRRRRRTRG